MKLDSQTCLILIPRSREVFHFHKPEALAQWLKIKDSDRQFSDVAKAAKRMPPLDESGLWKVQAKAIKNLEISLIDDRTKAKRISVGQMKKLRKSQWN